MTKPINLRQFKKHKARDDKAKQAEINRLAHGQPKAITDLARLKAYIAKRELDGKKLDSEGSIKPKNQPAHPD